LTLVPGVKPWPDTVAAAFGRPLAGEIVMLGAVTLTVVIPGTESEGATADTTACPTATPESRPEVDTEAIEGSEDDQLTVPVRSLEVPSEYRPVAVSC
jgi:hypothetical protein